MWFEGGSEGEESVDSLGQGRRRLCKSLTRRNRKGGSRDRTSRLTTLLSFSRGCHSLGAGGVALEDMEVGGRQSGSKWPAVQAGPGVFPFGEFLCFPGIGVFVGKRLRVAIKYGRGS